MKRPRKDEDLDEYPYQAPTIGSYSIDRGVKEDKEIKIYGFIRPKKKKKDRKK